MASQFVSNPSQFHRLIATAGPNILTLPWEYLCPNVTPEDRPTGIKSASQTIGGPIQYGTVDTIKYENGSRRMLLRKFQPLIDDPSLTHSMEARDATAEIFGGAFRFNLGGHDRIRGITGMPEPGDIIIGAEATFLNDDYRLTHIVGALRPSQPQVQESMRFYGYDESGLRVMQVEIGKIFRPLRTEVCG